MLSALSTTRSRLLASIVLGASVLSGGVGAAHAAVERPVVFSLSIDESPLDRCGGEKALAGAVEARLHRSVFTGADVSDITIAVTSEPSAKTEESWRAQIVAKDRADAELGRRVVPLPTNDCPKALDTLAVVLAIMIGPARTTTDPPYHAEPEPEPEPELEVAPPPADRKRPKRRPPVPPEPLRWAASPVAGVTGGTGILPGVSFGAEAGALVRPPVRRLAMIARAAYWFEVTTPTLPPAGVDRFAVAILGCYELIRAGDFGTLGCLGAEASRIEARSSNLTVPSESSIAAAVLGEARLGYRLAVRNRVVVEPYLAPQVSAVIRRDRFTYRDPSGRERTLLLPAPAAFQASFGVAVHFP